MNFSFPSLEFDEAVAAVCHGAATEPEMRGLNELLRSDARARDEYLMRVELHNRLGSEPSLFSKEETAAARCRLPAIHREDRDDLLVPRLTASAALRRLAPALALAACLLLGAVGVWSLWLKGPEARPGATSAAVAMLTRTVDVRWSQGAVAPRVGGSLEPGWLRLESGLAQVVFYSGARVVIEGPAELRLDSPNEAFCPKGRLLAEVPQPARGFRLKTDRLEAVDLGTAFGIDAKQGRTEVHVFTGKVELLAGAGAKRSLGEGQAAAVEANSQPRPMAASAAAFAALFEFQQRSLASEAFRYEQWQFANARLNPDSSLVVHLDFQDLDESGWTLRNAAESDLSVTEATIVGCQRAEGRWREKRALEFQSVNDRVRLDVPGEFEALTLSLWVRLSGLDRQFNSLFMCDGFEPGTLHWLIRNDGALGLTLFGPGEGNFQILASPAALTPDKFGVWLHVAVVLDGPARQAVQYLNGNALGRHALKLAPPYRLGPAELGNWNAHDQPHAAPSLIRNLSGTLDEFELFSRALSEAEVRELFVKGKPDA